MTAAELKAMRLEMKFDKASLALTLSVPYRTLQDYESGARGISDSFADKMRAAHAKDRAFMAGLPDRVEQELQRTFPHGIPSAVVLSRDNEYY